MAKPKTPKTPDALITCEVRDDRKNFTITFSLGLLASKREKYGERLIEPRF